MIQNHENIDSPFVHVRTCQNQKPARTSADFSAILNTRCMIGCKTNKVEKNILQRLANAFRGKK